MKLLWVHTPSATTKGKGGFRQLSDADAATVEAAGQGVNPLVGLLKMKPVGPAAVAPKPPVDPDAKKSKAKSKAPVEKKAES